MAAAAFTGAHKTELLAVGVVDLQAAAFQVAGDGGNLGDAGGGIDDEKAIAGRVGAEADTALAVLGADPQYAVVVFVGGGDQNGLALGVDELDGAGAHDLLRTAAHAREKDAHRDAEEDHDIGDCQRGQ